MRDSRPMTTEEKYYTFLDQTWPMATMVVAALDAQPTDAAVESAWRDLADARVFVRLAATAELRLEDVGTAHDTFSVHEVPGDRWREHLDEESRTRHELGTSLRCRYLRSTDGLRSWLVLSGHHAIVDGRIGVRHLQLLVRAIDGQPIPEQQAISQPAAPRQRPWHGDRRELLRLLHEIRDEQDALGVVGPASWPATGVERTPRAYSLNFDAETSEACLAAMRARRIRPIPALSAAWMSAVHDVLTDGSPTTLQLGTAVDVNPDTRPGDDALSPMTIGVVTNRFGVVAGQATASLADEVAAKLRHSMEAHHDGLFFELSRIDPITDLETGTRHVAQLVESAQPTVNVTNVGVVDPGSDPPWLRWMCGYMAPTPNQVVFVSGVGYRGRLINSVTVDRQRVSDADTGRMIEQVRRSMDELAVRP